MYFLFYPRGMGNPFYISFFQIDAGWHFARNKRLYHCDRHLALSLIDERSSYQFTEFYRGVCYLGDKHGEDLCTWIHNAQHLLCNCKYCIKNSAKHFVQRPIRTQPNSYTRDQFLQILLLVPEFLHTQTDKRSKTYFVYEFKPKWNNRK